VTRLLRLDQGQSCRENQENREHNQADHRQARA
jgi:hypothetical protein